MSVSGIDYNIDQSLTGIGLDALNLNTLNVNTLNNISRQTLSYLDATSSIQTQINNLSGSSGSAGGSGGGYLVVYGKQDRFSSTYKWNIGNNSSGGDFVFLPACKLLSVVVKFANGDYPSTYNNTIRMGIINETNFN
jgi:hypothetical protein